MNAYRTWRRQLWELQLKIEAFDEAWDYSRRIDEYVSERQALVDELEAHYAKEGDAIKEDGA